MNQILFATHNRKKLAEINQMLSGMSLECLSASDTNLPDVEETGETFLENALLKARAGAKHTGLPTLADDSGLIVPALRGAPGVKSARYAGENASDEQNMTKLLHALKHFQEDAPERTAFFYCVLVLMRHGDDPTPLIAQGYWQGRIHTQALGENGFGYDPIFLTDSGRTAAQLSQEEKHTLSHRGQAFKALMKQLPMLYNLTQTISA